jgi:hypothetical protein
VVATPENNFVPPGNQSLAANRLRRIRGTIKQYLIATANAAQND